ncbi:MAG TPA: hypothetical protein VKV02_03945, partial [Acidobacteriaceae bacterium]|nr:hypothetical protein [Acidobacteriaceae bacterium]
MRLFVRFAILGLGSVAPLRAQGSCAPGALAEAAKTVAAVRHSLHGQSVGESDPVVPAAVAQQLMQLKDSLALAAEAAFACAPVTSTPDALQSTLSAALHANVASAAEQAVVDVKARRDIGAYGSDLAVQVFQLFGKPKFYEVDFRYGIECGDDNLLLVYEAAGDTDGAWRKRLRWDAPTYRTVGDAIGDFVMLTPLTGNDQHPSWRFVVAHGQPACGKLPRPSQFDLDLLSPASDGSRPTVDWHFEHAYTNGTNTVPRLATTEDTIDVQLTSAPEIPGKKPAKPPTVESYRFHLTADGRIEPSPASAESEGPAGTTVSKPST